MKRVLWILIPLVVLGLLIGWRLHLNSVNADAISNGGGQHHQMVVGSGLVVARDMTTTFEATSNIESPNTIHIAPKLQELIDNLTVVEGDHVTAGEVLVRLDDADIMAQVRKMQANLSEAQARYVQAQVTQNPVNVGVGTSILQMEAGVSTAKANYDDVVESFNAQIAAAQAAVTDAQGRVDVANAGVNNAKAQIVAAKANLDDATLKLTRDTTLFNQNFIAAQDVDDQRAAVAVQQGAYDVAQSQLASAQAALDSANAEKNAAQQQADITRTKAQTDIDAARASMKQSKAALVNAQANVAQKPAYVANLLALKAAIQSAAADLANAEAMEAQTVLISPVDGYITSRLQDPGSMAAIGSPILNIQTMSTVWVNMPVPEEQIAHATIGLPANVTIDSIPGRIFNGTIVQVNPSADPTSRDFTVRIALSNPGNVLKPGMFARASFVTERLFGVTAVAPEAVQTDSDGSNYAWVINADKTITKTPITIGETVDGFVHVESGLTLGQRVITTFNGNLKDGQKVVLAGRHRKGGAATHGAAPDSGAPPAASTAAYSAGTATASGVAASGAPPATQPSDLVGASPTAGVPAGGAPPAGAPGGAPGPGGHHHHHHGGASPADGTAPATGD